MDKVRIGVVGVGGMGSSHLNYMNRVEGVELTAVCDIDAETLEARREQYGVQGFDNHQALLDSGLCDAVIVATPHYDHPPIAMAAFDRGIHVLCEKPIGAYTKQAREAIAAWEQTDGIVFAAMFQQRTSPIYRKAKQLIEQGEIGRLRRMTCLATDWFRSQAYYDSGGWRATWEGEGGGVIINQCPHTLDMIAWLVGMPSRVTASVYLGKYHHIEVEDEVQALLEYPDGAIGHFATSTGEAPGTSRIEIAGDRGSMVIEGGRIRLARSGGSVQEYCDTTDERFRKPEFKRDEIVLERQMASPHMEVTQNFVNAILHGEALIAPAPEGLSELALGNAMMLSGLKKKPVDLPFDDDEYKALLDELISNSTFEKKTVEKPVKDDMASSWH